MKGIPPINRCRRLAACICAAGLPLAGSANAGSLDLNFNNYSFAINGATAIGSLAQDAQAQLNAGYLYDGDRHGDHLDFAHLGILASGQVGPDGAYAGIGLRGFLADRGGSHNDGGGAAIGGDLSYRFPQLNDRLGLSGYLYYSPNVLTFGDFRHYLDYGIDLDYQIIHPAFLYVGWRRLTLPLEGDEGRSDHADQGFHIGVRITF